MKRSITTILLVIYTAFNLGLVVNLHYCAGKVSSISFLADKDELCGFCGKKKKDKKCCEDKQTQLSVEEHKSNASVSFDFSNHAYDLPPYLRRGVLQKKIQLVTSQLEFYVYAIGPPKIPIYIQVRTLLI